MHSVAPLQFQAQWDRKKPPPESDWHIPIDKNSDYIEFSDGKYQATDKLTQRIINTLFQAENSGFLVITGFMKSLGLNEKEIVHFQDKTTRQICSKMGWIPQKSEPERLDIKDSGHMDIHCDFSSHKGRTNSLVTLSYSPFEGLLGEEGIPQLTSLQSWAQELSEPIKGFVSNFVFKHWDSFLGYQFFSKLMFFPFANQLQQKILKNHTIKLDSIDYKSDMPLAFFNNDPDTGIAHSRTKLQKGVNNGTDRKRVLYRASGKKKIR